MNDDETPIDFKKAKIMLKNKKSDKNQRLQGVDSVKNISKLHASKKNDGKLFNNFNELRKQKENQIKDKLKEIKMIKKRLESEEYTYKVLQIAQEIFVSTKPHLLSTEQERLAVAESSIQAGQAFYKMAKNFVEYVGMEDLIGDIMENKNDP